MSETARNTAGGGTEAPEGGAASEKPKNATDRPEKKEGDDLKDEKKVPSEPEPTDQEKKDLEERTKEQIAADQRNQKQDKKCNCSKATCKSCCKKFATALVSALLVNMLTAAFFAIVFVIFLQILNIGNDIMVDDIIMMNGPAGSVVAPRNPCRINGTWYRFQRFALGGVAAKSECTQQVLVVDLWFELKKQRDYASSLKPSSFNRSSSDYNTAVQNIADMISACTGGAGIDNPKAYQDYITENNHYCFLIGFNPVINWIPEAELDFTKYPLKQAMDILKRTSTAPDTSFREMATNWAGIIGDKLHQGYSMNEAVHLANRMFNLDPLDTLRLSPRHANYTTDCVTNKNGMSICSKGPHEQAERKSYLGSQITSYQQYSSVSPIEDAGKYVPVICEADYPALATKVQLKTVPENGIFIPSFNIYTGDKVDFTRSAVAIIIPPKLYSAIATVECTFLARNVNFRESSGGNLEFMFSYYG